MDYGEAPVGKVEISMSYVFTALAGTGIFLLSIVIWWLRQAPPSLTSSDRSSAWGMSISGRPGVRSSATAAMMRVERGSQSTRSQRQQPQQVYHDGSEIDDDDDGGVSDSSLIQASGNEQPRKKIGAKKAAKLEAKAEKRAAREAMLIEREEKRKKQEQLDELRRIEEEKERQAELAQEERERLECEEKARKEQEEYEKLAASFAIEEEGFDEENVENKDEIEKNKLQAFIDYLNEKKVVLVEDLATEFKMRSKDVVDRIQKLLSTGQLVGIIDDRGKFISITRDELGAVAKFIRQRGRVSISEIVINSNKLINLKPTQSQPENQEISS